MNQGVGNKILETLPQRIDKQHVLFFDMDGTLIDTNYANYLSYTQAIQQVLKTESDISYAPDIRFTRMHLKKIFPSLEKAEYEKIIQLKNNFYTEQLSKTELNVAIVQIKKILQNKYDGTGHKLPGR